MSSYNLVKMLIALVLLITTGCQDSPDNRQVLEFWAMGAEGELPPEGGMTPEDVGQPAEMAPAAAL